MSVVSSAMSRSWEERSEKPGRTCRACSLSSAATREGLVSTEGEEPANSATLIRCCLEESGDGVTAVGPVDGTAVNCKVLKRAISYQFGSGSTSRTM